MTNLETIKSKYPRVLVLMGGETEREVSLRSGGAVAKSLSNMGFDTIKFDPKEQSLFAIQALKPSVVFNILHGGIGENGVIQGFLEAVNIPFTGSKHLGSALSMEKSLCKTLWQAAGFPTIPSLTLNKSDATKLTSVNLKLPLAVKPCNGGSSFGVSKVNHMSELGAAMAHAFAYDDNILIEEWLAGSEYAVGILGGRALPSIKITPASPAGWYDYEAKYGNFPNKYELDTLPPAQETFIQQLALQAFALIRGSGWGRIDFIKHHDDFYILEANFSPGMTEASLVPKGAARLGLSFDDLVLKILETV